MTHFFMKVIGSVSAATTCLLTLPAHAGASKQPLSKFHVQEAQGICGLTDIEALPFLKHDVQIDYTGSMDKKGGNGDGVWWLYQDRATAEWVIFDVDGPGCIYQLYNHRGYPGYRGHWEKKDAVSDQNIPDTVYRFYFDGAAKPQFTLKTSEFGTLPGFEAPLTDAYLNWVRRTWFPMFFRTGCRITTSMQQSSPCGCGTVVYHSYATADAVPSFQDFLPRLYDVKRTLTVTPGTDPKPTDGNMRHTAEVTLAPGGRQTLLDTQGCASIAACTLKMEPYNPNLLQKVRVRLFFDDLNKPCVEVPFGSFFGNARGTTNTLMVMQGLEVRQKDDTYTSARGYTFFPMPFWKAARVEVAGATNLPSDVKIVAEFSIRPSEKTAYPQKTCGYFRAVYRDPYNPQDGADTEYASIRGTGHLVACTFASQGICEEDFRFYIDGCATAKIESDGAESWGGFGWGFYGPYSGPLTCQDSKNGGWTRTAWMQTRDMLGDCYPFHSRIDVRQENIWGMQKDWGYRPGKTRDYQGAVFYYGIDAPTLVQTDALDVGDPASERTHDYRSDGTPVTLTSRYEGCSFMADQYSGGFVPGEVTDSGRAVTNASEFTVAVRPDNEGVRLRRRSDQTFGRQRAEVFVDDKPVTERTWYRADRNPHLRWLEDEFEIPVRYTKGKDKIRVRLVFRPTVLRLPQQQNTPPVLPDACLTDGRFGKALRGEAFQQPIACTMHTPKSAYTVVFWVRFAEKRLGLQSLLLWNGFWELLSDSGCLAIRTPSEEGKHFKDAQTGAEEWKRLNRTTGIPIADGLWHHVAASENDRRLCLFVDGKRVLDVTIDRKQPFGKGGELRVGYRENVWPGNVGMPFEGALDDLRFSSAFRDAVTVPASPAVPDADTFALWHFDQTTAPDRINNDAANAPALVVRAKSPTFVPSGMDAPATAWSEFYYWTFCHVSPP
jgi:hypothetical protein